jgi:hypothetical protein
MGLFDWRRARQLERAAGEDAPLPRNAGLGAAACSVVPRDAVVLWRVHVARLGVARRTPIFFGEST